MLTLLRLATNFEASSTGNGSVLLPRTSRSACRLATGRSALFHLIGRLPESYARTVLLPSYIAEGVVKPFAVSGYELRYYRLTPDLEPDASDVAALLRDQLEPVVFVLIHYFGKPSASPELISMLRRAGALIVSDCAHAPLSRTEDGMPLGELGDIALYSLNKLLPVSDGAILLSLTPEIDLALDENCLPSLPLPAIEAYGRHLLACRGLFEASDPESAAGYLGEIEAGYEKYYAYINDDLAPHRQSPESRYIESIFPYSEVAKVRRSHAIRLQSVIASNCVLQPLWQKLPDNMVPFAFPVRVPAPRREAIQQQLFENGVMASTLCDKWDFVPRELVNRFEVEIEFLQEHLLLPVSEFISEGDAARLESVIKHLH